MVGQQRVGMHPHPEAGGQLANQPDEALKVRLGLKELSPLEASIEDVIPPILERNAQRPSHRERDSEGGQNLQAKTTNLRPDPLFYSISIRSGAAKNYSRRIIF